MIAWNSLVCLILVITVHALPKPPRTRIKMPTFISDATVININKIPGRTVALVMEGYGAMDGPSVRSHISTKPKYYLEGPADSKIFNSFESMLALADNNVPDFVSNGIPKFMNASSFYATKTMSYLVNGNYNGMSCVKQQVTSPPSSDVWGTFSRFAYVGSRLVRVFDDISENVASRFGPPPKSNRNQGRVTDTTFNILIDAMDGSFVGSYNEEVRSSSRTATLVIIEQYGPVSSSKLNSFLTVPPVVALQCKTQTSQ